MDASQRIAAEDLGWHPTVFRETFSVVNTKLLFILGLVLAAPLAAQTSSNANAFLLKGDDSKVQADKSVLITGHAAVVTKVGVRFTAEQLVFDQESGTVKLSGDVTIHTADGSTVPVKELIIDVREKRVFMLSGGSVGLVNQSPAVSAEATSIEFTREFPKTELDLRRAKMNPRYPFTAPEVRPEMNSR